MIPTLRLFLQQLRPHQLIYQFSLLIVALLINDYQYDQKSLLIGVLFILLITPTFVLMNDYAHRKEDLIMGRNRFLSQITSPILILLVFILVMIFLNYLSLLSGSITFTSFWLLFFTTVGYGYAKKQRLMIISYTGRFLSGFFTMLLYGSIINSDLTELLLLSGLIIGYLDIIGNIAGDFRDYKHDQFARVKTLPVIYGPKRTMQFLILLIIFLYFFLFMLDLDPFTLMIAFTWNLIAIFWYKHSSEIWAHAAFHGPKLQQFIWIGLALNTTSLNSHLFADLILLGMLVGFMWFISYYLYLWSGDLTQFHFSRGLFSYLNHSENKLISK